MGGKAAWDVLRSLFFVFKAPHAMRDGAFLRPNAEQPQTKNQEPATKNSGISRPNSLVFIKKT